MEFLVAVFDLLSGIAWPAAVIALAVIFRRNFARLLDRIKKIGPTGAEMADVEAKAQESSYQTPASIDELKALKNFPSTGAMKRIKLDLHLSLEEFNEDDRIDVLVNRLALSRLDLHCSAAYQYMSGNQERFLVLLSFAPQPVPTGERFLEETKRLSPGVIDDWDVERWTWHLIRDELAVRTEAGFQITDTGLHFLGFLERFGFRGSKVF